MVAGGDLDGPSHALIGPSPPVGSWVVFHGGTDGATLLGDPIADPGTARGAMARLAAGRGLCPRHAVPVEAAARGVVAQPGIDDPALDDLTELPFVTIDEPHSKDLDQALFVAAVDDGFRVCYAIADPAWSVCPGSALFEEALRRGGTYYLPGLTIPMLPPSLSEGVISLNEGVDRRAMVFDLVLDRAGAVVSTRIRRARVRSRVKTHYDAVQAWFDGRGPLPGDDARVAGSLAAFARVGALRVRRAAARGIVQVRRHELAVGVEQDGLRFVAVADPRNDVERWNEQISLLCNQVGARILRDAAREGASHVQPIYRVHAPPAAKDLATLSSRLGALARAHRLDDAWHWRPDGPTSLADFLADLPHEGPRARLAQAIHRQAMLVGGRSGFAAAPGMHHGVGAEVYGRFTAPMREVVGVFLHKEMWEREHSRGATVEADEALRVEVLSAANRSRNLQRVLDRSANRLVLDQLFEDDLARADDPPRRSGTIMGITRDKIHVQLDSPPIDVKVYVGHVRAAQGKTLRSGRDGVSLRGPGGRLEWATGDAVSVVVRGRDATRDRWELALVDGEARRGGAR